MLKFLIYIIGKYEKIYSLFPKCKQYMKDEASTFTSSYNNECSQIKVKFSDITDSNVLNICHKSINFLFQIFTSPDDSLKNVAVQYLYYWINQKEQTKVVDITRINEFYKELISIVKKNILSFEYYNIYLEYDIDDLQIINDIYNIITSIKNIIQSDNINCDGKEKHCAKECEERYNRLYNICKDKHNTDLCNELKNIRKKLHDHNIINKYNISIPEMISYLERQDIILPILIPIVITLLVSCLLFYIYKVNNKYIYLPNNEIFTPHGTLLQYAVKSIRNKFKNTYKVLDTKHSYENYDNSWETGYNVLYNSA
ncbi:variable surface protein [Plasmodium gonderi]|uniref:Variable surface protein n=1 Tax=Plasmodium gonderi TaxID=77519 RepID=A0A1Y1JRH5_PLAGO|nr:variable surface protein [Plasmodium gonderi]GAW84095.1 variable surface protein [Plasmodium gonderi]